MKRKKLLLCLLSAVVGFGFCSCDNSKDEPNVIYLDNKLIEGVWHDTLKNAYYTIDSIVYTFENDKASEIYYAHIGGLDTLKYEGNTDYGNYRLTDTLIFVSMPTDQKFKYKLSSNKDSLYLHQLPLDKNYGRWLTKVCL